MTGYNFTDHVRRALQLAREEAALLNHGHVGTEHQLLGVLGAGQGVALLAVANLGIDRSRLRDGVLAVLKPGSGSASGPDLPYTARARKALELAMTEARELGYTYVGTEHLLLGLLREGKGIAGQVLAQNGATLERLRAEIVRLLGPERAAGETDAAATPSGPISVTILVDRPDGRLVAVKFTEIESAIEYLATLRGQQPPAGAG